MPSVPRNGAEIHYVVEGHGPPLVLLEGLGYGRWMWQAQIAPLAETRRLLLIDNRGIAPSTPLPGPYSIDEFARDALAVLDAEGIERAMFLGVSMGGFIAQKIAEIAPGRVERLILVSTSPGGPEAFPMPAPTWAELTRSVPEESPEARLRRTMALALTPEFPTTRRDEFDRLIQRRLGEPQDSRQWGFQAASTVAFDASLSDRSVESPALIVAGTDDRVLPWWNSVLLFRLLPHPTLLLFRGQNHLVFLERAEEFNRSVQEYLAGPPGPPPHIREVT